MLCHVLHAYFLISIAVFSVAGIRFRPVPFPVSYTLSFGLIDGKKREVSPNNSILFWLAGGFGFRFCTGGIRSLISKCSPLNNTNRY